METKLTLNSHDNNELIIEDDIDGIIFTIEGRDYDIEDNFIASMRIDANEAELLVKVLRHYIGTISQNADPSK